MNENTILRTVPAANDLHKVPGFDPLKYLRKAVNEKGEPVMRLELRYQRLWFRLACPKGRMLLNPLRVTDQLAIFEAKVFFHQDDAAPASCFTANKAAKETPGYIRAAQDEALMVALDNAGFGIQLCDVTSEPRGGENCPPVQANSDRQNAPAPEPAPIEQTTPAPEPDPVEQTAPAPEPAPVSPVQTVEPPAAAEPAPEPVPVEQTAPAPESAPVEQTAPAPEPAPIEQTAPAPEPVPIEQTAPADQTLETLAAKNDPKPAPAPQNVPAADPAPAPAEHQELLNAGQSEEPAVVSDNQQSAVVTTLNFPTQEEAASDASEQAETPPQAAPSYTEDMSVEEICQVMTLEEAGAIVVPRGPNTGWTMAQVAERRPSSLRFFITPFYECSNSQKAAATLLLQDIEMKKAG